MKRFLFFATITFALIMSSCSGNDDYKSYVPADSKVVGKFDLKEFITQSGVDKDKLFEQIKQYAGDELGDMKDNGLDLASPVYFFVRKQDSTFVFGAVAKVESREKAEAFYAKKAKQPIKKEANYSCGLNKEGVSVAINDDVFVMMGSSEGGAETQKAALDKIMAKGYGNVESNKLMAQADAQGLFFSLHADLSIIPFDQLAESGLNADDFKDYKDMIYGFDGTVKDGICDIATTVESTNKASQAKIDQLKKAMGTISPDAAKAFTVEDVIGFAINTDGAKLAEYVKDALAKVQVAGEGDVKIKNNVVALLSKIKGNVTFSMKDLQHIMFKAEGQNIAPDVATMFKDIDPSAVGTEGNGYKLGNFMWFGYEGNKFYLTTNKESAAEPSKLMGVAAPAQLAELLKTHRQVFFINLPKVVEVMKTMGTVEVKVPQEVVDKVKYVTITYK